MKKILLTTAAVAAISTSAFAADMMENQFFLRGDVSGVMFSKFKTSDADAGSVKIKSNKVGFGIDVGAGYYVMDNVRVELVYNQPFASNFKGSTATGKALVTAPALAANPTAAQIAANTVVTNVSIKHKPTVRALFARVSGDVIDLGMGKIFLTGGLGWSQVKNSVTVTDTKSTLQTIAVAAVGNVAAIPAAYATTTPSTTYKAKNKNNLAWTVGAGAAFDVADGVHLDVAYSYRAYGKSKAAKATGQTDISGTTFNSHNLSAGVRFDI